MYKSIIYAKPAFKRGLVCSSAGAQRTEFYTTWRSRCLMLSQAYAQRAHWDLAKNLFCCNICSQPKTEVSSGSETVFHYCGALVSLHLNQQVISMNTV